ncbi:helix-turn-helix transcriptional regulator [Saccharomonospora xinjiangensis]|uniref:helix-turn-helix transcriptional regulator n=1 Tax=Saccharomonospora xinjiangensis TaxID=75294 RepID=UPI00106F486C|nr:LuxR family transcriptional regulator [Saccharomonospora xinjiangensis]
MGPVLHGREAETETLAALLEKARAGTSAALVLRGEPGIGKTALLDHVAEAAPDLRLLRGAGVEFEAELPFAGLQLLLRPALGCLPALPGPQRETLEAIFGLGRGSAFEPTLAGLAVLSLLTEHAGEEGLLCLLDDAHWLDSASRDALVFAARRLHAEGVIMLFAARDGEGSFPGPGLPELRLTGLAPHAALALLDRHPLTPAARDRLLLEARGNPLALLELPLALAEDGGSASSAGALPLTSRLHLAFHGQVSRMPSACQTLLLVAAMDETGELAVILRAAATLGIGAEDLAPAEEAGLVLRGDAEGTTIRFRHPLLRAAVHHRAPVAARLAVHRALAVALDPAASADHADRRAWHLAAATTGADEEVAAALESTATRARERGGHEAAASAYERAARLSAGPPARARREALAAEAALEAGDLDRAGVLGDRAARHADPSVVLRLTRVRAQASFWQGAYSTAHGMLLDGADLARHSDPGEAAGLLVQALHTSWYLGEGHLAATLDRLAALRLADEHPLTPVRSYLTQLTRAGRDGSQPTPLRETLAAVSRRGRIPEQVAAILCGAALALGQDTDASTAASALADQHRASGGAGRLPTVLFFVAEGEVFTGRHRDALTTATEALRLARDTGQTQWVSQFSSVLAYLAAAEGDEAACVRHAEEALANAGNATMSPGAPWAHWSLGLLNLGLGRAEAALDHFERMMREPMRHHICATRATPDLVEAAVRVDAAGRAAEPLARFERWAASARQRWADALVLRCHALLATDARAEVSYVRALDQHDRGGRSVEYARTSLLYGEWLRRARRKADARRHLSAAVEVFDRLGMRPWADRARGELTATGVKPERPRGARGAAAGLTPQEAQIVRLAATGLSNRDIAAQLFLSHRTVGYHLYKAYPKLGVTSRGELGELADVLGL